MTSEANYWFNAWYKQHTKRYEAERRAHKLKDMVKCLLLLLGMSCALWFCFLFLVASDYYG
jgi:hypothetical protein